MVRRLSIPTKMGNRGGHAVLICCPLHTCTRLNTFHQFGFDRSGTVSQERPCFAHARLLSEARLASTLGKLTTQSHVTTAPDMLILISC